MSRVESGRALRGVVPVLAFAAAAIAGLAAAAAQQPAAAPVPAILQSYKPVTAERLKNPEEGDWLMVRRTYDGWGYSPLDKITPANVGRLQPAWVFATGVTNGHQAPPIVNSGVMFAATPGNQVIAIDARTGGLLWRYRRPLPEDVILLHATSRGVALYGDKVYFAAGEAVLVALDARTGKEIWTTKVGENKNGYYMSLAPLVVDGKVLVGTSGGELGVRGFVAAYDADSGKELWRTFTIPAPGEPGSETWPKGELRSRDQPRVLGHRQRWAVDGRSTARRQPVHLIDRGNRSRDGTNQRAPSVRSERVVGLG